MNINIALQILVYKLSLNITYKYADLFLFPNKHLMKQVVSPSKSINDIYGYPLAEINWKVSSKDNESVENFIKF